jgi:hypothetical protein
MTVGGRRRGSARPSSPTGKEGHAASSGARVVRVDLSTEAIRLTRALHAALPHDPEVAGLLALMLLTDARRLARTGPAGELVPLAEQDRSRWDHGLIAEGVALCRKSCSGEPSGSTNCRPPSPPSTTRPPPRTRLTGRRSSPCTDSWNA